MSSPEFGPNDVAAAIDHKLTGVGRRRWTDVIITWSEGITPQDGQADIAATDDQGEPIRDRVYVALVNDTWRVALGGKDSVGDGKPDLVGGSVDPSAE